MESQTCAAGGWGPMFGTKSQINTVFFLTPSLSNLIDHGRTSDKTKPWNWGLSGKVNHNLACLLMRKKKAWVLWIAKFGHFDERATNGKILSTFVSPTYRWAGETKHRPLRAGVKWRWQELRLLSASGIFQWFFIPTCILMSDLFTDHQKKILKLTQWELVEGKLVAMEEVKEDNGTT